MGSQQLEHVTDEEGPMGRWADSTTTHSASTGEVRPDAAANVDAGGRARDTSHDAELFAHYAEGAGVHSNAAKQPIDPGLAHDGTEADDGSSTQELHARVIEFSTTGGGSRIIVSKGRKHGVYEGAYGRVIRANGKTLAPFSVGVLRETECEATGVDATLDDLQQNRDVLIMSSKPVGNTH